MLKTIQNNYIYEFEIKKSKFIGYAFLVSSEKEIESYLNSVRVEHSNATHVCYGYTFNNTAKCSDDGEPSGTAGLPILEVIKKNRLANVLLIVVRYFGGIKLGAGGLIRAYSRCASDTIKCAGVKELNLYTTYTLEVLYGNMPQVNKIIKDNNCIVLNTVYENNVICTIATNIDVSIFQSCCVSVNKNGEVWL